MKLTQILLFALLCGVIAPTVAHDDYDVYVCKIQTSAGGTVYIHPCGGWIARYGRHNDWIIWDGTTPGGKNMYTNASLAIALDFPVTVRIVGDPSDYYDQTSMIRLNAQ